MNRISVIQMLINKLSMEKPVTYLEIGSAAGMTLFKIKAKRKIAVDLRLDYKKTKKIKWMFKNICNINNRYYKTTSNKFFEKQTDVLLKHGLDVVFIDGLHTYRQSLEDVQNALKFLNERGVIVMHDCNPPSEAAAYPTDSLEHAVSLNLPGWTGQWCGDVWKTICYLRSIEKDLRVFVLDCDYGLGIIARGQPENLLDFSAEQIEDFSYSDLVNNHQRLLNLKPAGYINEFIGFV